MFLSGMQWNCKGRQTVFMNAHLTAISGGLGTPILLAGDLPRIVPRRVEDELPPSVVTVDEQDTYQLLTPAEILPTLREHPIRVHTDLMEQQPIAVGTVLNRNNRLIVIVYDVDAHPITHPEWIRSAYRNLLLYVAKQGLSELEVPLLGCRYDVVGHRVSCRLLLEAMCSVGCGPLATIHLRLAPQQLGDTVNLLQSVDCI